MPFDPNGDISSQYYKWMCRHLVVLSAFVDEVQDDSTIHRRLIALSGFLMLLHDMPFWVTAGHCFRDLNKLMDRPGTTVSEFAFADYFGLDAINEHDIPFPYERGIEKWCYRPDLYLDFALVPIPHLICQGFIANGIKATSRANWIKQGGLAFEHFQLLGVPKDFIGFTRQADGAYKRHFNPHLLIVLNLTADEAEEKPPEGWLGGRIHENAQIKDIAGMSGGPLFGFRKADDGQTHYFFCAAQSWWWPESRIIYGCPLPVFGEMMHDYVGYLLDRHQQ